MHVASHPGLHTVFEALAYTCGYLLYNLLRSRAGDPLPDDRRWLIIATTAIGALVGSRVLGILEQAPRLSFHWHTLLPLLSAARRQDIVGGPARRMARRRSRQAHPPHYHPHRRSLCHPALRLASPSAASVLSCRPRRRYLWHTLAAPLGSRFRRRHPAPPHASCTRLSFYFCSPSPSISSAAALIATGCSSRIFIGAYLLWRLVIDFIKPQPLVHGLNMIQWACIAGLLALGVGSAWPVPPPEVKHA